MSAVINKLWVILVLLCFAQAGHAAVAVCSTSSPGNTFASYGSSSLINGCSQVDKTFSLFNVTGASCTAGTGCTTSDSTNTDIYGTGSLTSGSTPGFAGTITGNLNGGSPTVMVMNVAGANGTDTGTLTYAVQANVGSPSNPALQWFIGGNIGLVPAGSITVPVAGGAKETIQVVETFCINATTVTGCAPANTGTISGNLTVSGTTTGTFSTFVFNGCSAGANVGTCNGGASGSSIALTNLVSSIGVSDQFTLTSVAGNGSVLTLNNIGNAFDEFAAATTVPEPSTIWLSVAGLAAFAVLRRRRRS